ncbi:uncharacterized protein LOC121872563 [Homarus americanus]|uniref:uncharacterized protein LOC121872563 n=1 Tax=Homarus americanus TaxID=6706 RepID=UPI001C436876|nr:uncharacterized protein LOC121872563 [Homarus americanus]
MNGCGGEMEIITSEPIILKMGKEKGLGSVRLTSVSAIMIKLVVIFNSTYLSCRLKTTSVSGGEIGALILMDWQVSKLKAVIITLNASFRMWNGKHIKPLCLL